MVKALIISYYLASGILNEGVLLVDNTGTVVTGNYTSVALSSNSPVSVQAGLTGAAISYAAGQGYTITASDVIMGTIFAPNNRTFTNPTRSLNTAFQVSATQDSQVAYTVNVAATLSLTSGATGTVLLEYADDSGFTTNVVTVQTSVNGNTGTLAIGLGLTQTGTASLSGMIPAGKYAKLVTANTAGTPTFTMGNAQEVLL